jgi:RND family efflux transporter MFP subunit
LGRLIGGSLKLLLAAVIIVAAIGAYRHQIKTSPRAGRKKPPRQARLVQVVRPEKGDHVTEVRAFGPVMPAQEVTLQPQVTGQIVELSPDVVPGCIVKAGQKLMAIDRRDYEILVSQRRSDVARATRDLKVEQGNQAVAQQEYELLGEVITEEDRELVLRQPQLESARAAKASAEAALRKAELDLSRCEIVAPFNAIVRDRHVDLGATVSLNSPLVTLVGTDSAWVELKVRVDELEWLFIPRGDDNEASTVRIYYKLAWGEDQFRTGRVVRVYGALESAGQLAQLLVEVDDPFCLTPENRDKPQLLMGSMVSAVVEGRTIESVYAIDRTNLRDNDALWIMNDSGELEIREVDVVFREPQRVYVRDGLSGSDRLVATDIAAPVPGMPLRVAGTEGEERPGPGRPSGGPPRARAMGNRPGQGGPQ